MTAHAARARGGAPVRGGQYRYGVVLLLLVLLLVFAIIAPDADWAHAVDPALAGSALAVAVGTSRAKGEVRRIRALAVTAVALLVVVLVGTGVFGVDLTFAVTTLLLAAVPVSLLGGLLRLIREHGVTVQAVAGALAIYLAIGLLFAAVITFVAAVESGPYFKQPADAASGVPVYYSFTVLPTTGFGDYTAATRVGHALAVLEMLTGQLYLVTVIGILVGNFATRRMRSDTNAGNP